MLHVTLIANIPYTCPWGDANWFTCSHHDKQTFDIAPCTFILQAGAHGSNVQTFHPAPCPRPAEAAWGNLCAFSPRQPARPISGWPAEGWGRSGLCVRYTARALPTAPQEPQLLPTGGRSAAAGAVRFPQLRLGWKRSPAERKGAIAP